MLVACHAEHVLLEQRPTQGIWGGLWSLPECESHHHAQQACERLGLAPKQLQTLTPFLHVFTHYRLTITPILVHVSNLTPQPEQPPFGEIIRRWVNYKNLRTLGLPAPVRKLLEGLQADHLLR
jgi:A/G-specific adenine glycosylase